MAQYSAMYINFADVLQGCRLTWCFAGIGRVSSKVNANNICMICRGIMRRGQIPWNWWRRADAWKFWFRMGA